MLSTRADVWRRGLAGLFALSGTAHFVFPRPFASIVPPVLGPSLPWVYASGAAELLCAAGLVFPSQAVRARASWASAALLVAVFPANVYMAIEAFRVPHSALYRVGTLSRLPVQVPLIATALAVWRAERTRRDR